MRLNKGLLSKQEDEDPILALLREESSESPDILLESAIEETPKS